MKTRSIKDDIEKIKGKKVLLRVDFNVPIKNGAIDDETKIVSSLSTIRFLLRYNCKIILITHLGRPGGKRVKNLSNLILAERLNKILKEGEDKDDSVKFINTWSDKKIKSKIEKIKEREIVFLENLRFKEEELKDDKNFAKFLAKLADVYINDAFSVSHRKHASISSVKSYLPSYPGFLMEEEMKNLDYLKKSKKPLILIMGGKKIETKIALIDNFKKRSHKILLGGALANNFIAGSGLNVGKSLVDEKNIKLAKKILKDSSDKLIFPIDVVINNKKDGSGKTEVKDVNDIKDGDYIFDIGPETIRIYAKFIKNANTLIWNGPMGWFEKRAFNQGTLIIARLLASRSTGKAFGVAGGGETVEALNQSKMKDYVDWVSTGGGAMLAYLGDKKMPGLKNLIKD